MLRTTARRRELFPLPVKASAAPLFPLPFKACPEPVEGGRAGVGMVLPLISSAAQEPHHPHPNPPLEGEGFKAATPNAGRGAAVEPLFPLPFKGRAGVGMVLPLISIAPQEPHHPHPNPPLEGEGFRAARGMSQVAAKTAPIRQSFT
jgi:hypothetical protein